jgi:hypothetical protein
MQLDNALQSVGGAQRVFISYSRADRQRVSGLASLLEALGNAVFMDTRAILPGQRWRDRIEEEIEAATILLVFWTRHSAQSQWVRQEYERFAFVNPDRPLVPVIGDATPLPSTLEAHQASDFCPFINEILSKVRELEDLGTPKRQIQEFVVQRLAEEGITLPKEKRRGLFCLFGVVGWSMAPLVMFYESWDFLVDSTLSVPRNYAYTAAIAAAAGIVSTGAIYTVSGAGDDLACPGLVPADIVENQSGEEACDAIGMICVSVSRARVTDRKGSFFGYSTPTCSAAIRRKKSCQEHFGTEFAMSGVIVRRSPDADPDVEQITDTSSFCLFTEEGKQGIYRSANCVAP